MFTTGSRILQRILIVRNQRVKTISSKMGVLIPFLDKALKILHDLIGLPRGNEKRIFAL